MDRSERRRRTLKIARRRRAEHLALVHRGGPIDCVCELSRTYFAKRTGRGCGCRKRKPGSPRGVGGRRPLRYEPLPQGSRWLDAFGRSAWGRWREQRDGYSCKQWARDRIYAARAQWREWSLAAAAGRVDRAEEPAAPRD